MPLVDGIEPPDFGNRSSTQVRKVKKHLPDRRAQWMARYNNIRSIAISLLGEECECGENRQLELQIVALTDEAKEWSQLTFYKRIIDAYKHEGNPYSLGKLICRKCRFHQMAIDAADAREADKGTRLFYWVGGQRVEQKKGKIGFCREFGCRFIRQEHEDLGITELEDENERQNQNFRP